MHPFLRSLVGLAGRIGTRAAAEGIHSVVDDLDSFATSSSRKLRKVKKKLKSVPKEYVEPESDE